MVNRILIKGKILDMKIPIFGQLQELVDKLQYNLKNMYVFCHNDY